MFPRKLRHPPPETVSPVSDIRTAIENAVLRRFQEALAEANLGQMRRAVWRIGELSIKSAVPDLIELIPAEDELMNYCTAWALGRCGDSQAFAALNRLNAQTNSEAVKRIVLESLLAAGSDDQRRELIAALVQELPEAVREALSADDSNQLAAAAAGTVFRGGQKSIELLEDLYRLAAVNPCARQFILSALSEIPLKPGYFKAIRHIYKAAEFRLDAEVVGLLALRFEIEKPQFYLASGSSHAPLPNTWKYVRLSDEVTKLDSRLAYSSRTRDYFRKRVWRMLRRMGSAADDQYVSMATSILLSFTDEHAAAAKKTQRTRWERDADGRWQPVTEPMKVYGPFGGYIAFNHILHTNSPRYELAASGVAWLTVGEEPTESPPALFDADPPPREEAFPELWDRQPEALWRLVTNSRCELVHRFATRALFDNTDFCKQLTTDQIRKLLSQSYAVTIELGLALARRRYDPSNPDFELIESLLAAELDRARQIARQWIEDRPEMLLDAAGLMTHILTSVYADVRQWGLTLIDRIGFSDIQIEGLIARIVVFLMGLDEPDDVSTPLIEDVSAVLLGIWAAYCGRLDISIIEDLLKHPLAALQILAGKLLLQHETPPAELPPGLISYLIEADLPALRGIGVQLLAGLPAELLLRQADLIFTFCTSEDRDVRRAAQPLVKRLAGSDVAFGRDLFDHLLPIVFRKAPSPEFREDLVALLSDALEKYALELDTNTIWRLLQARAWGARELGAHLLTRVEPQALSVRQWAQLGNHALLAVRQWTWRIYTECRTDVASNMTDGLRLLDSDWDDTRDFAINFFRDNFDASHWSPLLIVSLCDSIRGDVQRFGRELVATYFDEAHGVEYLLKLSQHPSINVQLFASNFLEDYARDDLKRIEQLTPYFTTVLSQVNCGRVAKARVFKFLHRMALKSAEAAALVAPICNRISATVAIGDRGTCVRILRDITRRYPQVETLLEPIPVPLRPVKTLEADHAV